MSKGARTDVFGLRHVAKFDGCLLMLFSPPFGRPGSACPGCRVRLGKW